MGISTSMKTHKSTRSQFICRVHQVTLKASLTDNQRHWQESGIMINYTSDHLCTVQSCTTTRKESSNQQEPQHTRFSVGQNVTNWHFNQFLHCVLVFWHSFIFHPYLNFWLNDQTDEDGVLSIYAASSKYAADRQQGLSNRATLSKKVPCAS